MSMCMSPKSGVAAMNEHRVLINLHGGGFSGCWPGCAELESIPISALMQIKVVTVDYREGPEYKFPAASEDVASVYGELLKAYKVKEHWNLWMLCRRWIDGDVDGVVSNPWPTGSGGDRYLLCIGRRIWRRCILHCICAGRGAIALYDSPGPNDFRILQCGQPRRSFVSPINSPDMLAKFPPTLLITGTRDFAISGALYTHEQLVKQGVDAELHVWEGSSMDSFTTPMYLSPETRSK